MATGLINNNEILFPDGSTQSQPAQFINTFPSGGIILWNSTSVPSGWFVCDGQNGTPNLIDRFVIAAGGGYPLNTTGGSSTIGTNNLPPHSHYLSSSASIGGSVTAAGLHSHGISDPGHTHQFSQNPSGGYANGGGSGTGTNYGSGRENGATSGISQGGYGMGADGSHLHNLSGSVSLSGTTGSAGSGAAYAPPFYALYYIMKA